MSVRTILCFSFIVIISLYTQSYAAVLPPRETICDTPSEEDKMHDYFHLSFFERTLNIGKYVPPDLVEVDMEYSADGDVQCLGQATYAAFLEMNNGLISDGYKGLKIRSAYRSHETQEHFKEIKGALAAEAGRSEHQIGTAVDLIGEDEDVQFARSQQYKWMKENAYKYGFVQSYQSDNVHVTGIPVEAWHWRYIGVDAATKINESDLDPNVYLYGLKLIPSTAQSFRVQPLLFQVAHSATLKLLRRVL